MMKPPRPRPSPPVVRRRSDGTIYTVPAPLNTLTPRLGLNKPDVGGDVDQWGYLLNANFDLLDAEVLPRDGGTMTGPLVINGADSGSRALVVLGGDLTVGNNHSITTAGTLLAGHVAVGVVGSAVGGFVGSWDITTSAYTGFYTDASGNMLFATADPQTGNVVSGSVRAAMTPTGLSVFGDLATTGTALLGRDPGAPLEAATKQYVDAHSGGGGGIAEAPSDGTIYGRKNAGWVPAPSGAAGSGTVGNGTPGQFALYSGATAIGGTSSLSQLAADRVAVGTVTDDGSSALQIGGSLTTYGSVTSQAAGPVAYQLYNTAAATDQKRFDFFFSGTAFALAFPNDANSTLNPFFNAARSGVNATQITITATTEINFVTPGLKQNGAPITGAGIGDAPSDGATYGRKNGAWAVAASGGASTPVLVNGSTIPATVGSPYVMQPTDYVVYVTSASAAYVTLPASPTIGATYRVLSPLTGVAAAPTTVAAPSGATLNGSGGFVQNSDADAMSYLAVSATVWRIV